MKSRLPIGICQFMTIRKYSAAPFELYVFFSRVSCDNLIPCSWRFQCVFGIYHVIVKDNNFSDLDLLHCLRICVLVVTCV